MEVSWTEGAKRDLEAIAWYIAAEAPINASKVVARLEAAAESLHVVARRGRHVPEFRDLGIDTWLEILAPPYRIIYQVIANTVSIDAVIDSRRRLGQVYLERMARHRI